MNTELAGWKGSLLPVFLAAYNSLVFAADFRGSDWYADMEIVRSNETAKPFSEAVEGLQDTLNYETSMLGKPVRVIYLFDKYCHELIQAQYRFHEKLGDESFQTLVNALVDKYGEYASGDLGVYKWMTPATTIELVRQSTLGENHGRTTATYTTSNYQWPDGWRANTEPDCPARQEALEAGKTRKEALESEL